MELTTASDPALAPGVAAPDAEAVLQLLEQLLATDLGRDELARLRFHRDGVELARLHRRLGEAQQWLAQGGYGFGGMDDPRPWLEQAGRAGAVLEGAELVGVRGFLDAVAGLRQSVLGGEDGGRWPELEELAAALPECHELRRRLGHALLPSGELSDEASPELARIRGRRLRQRQQIEAALAQLQRRLGGEGVLQDELVTMRNERFVLPVRTEQRRRAAGVVHGASSSGQTVFVEPLETIELNNEHIRLRDEEQAEVQRILAELTGLVGAAGEALEGAAELCGVLELELAKARFGTEYGGGPAEFGPAIELVEARHPLLLATLRRQPGRAVVPLSLRLEQERVLVVSGPNTGGKTVVLKTVGMAAWMAQCGLPVCARQARLPILDALWADVGDVQSIQASLSTFSSHLLHIKSILTTAGAASLVLLDELGTATNAAEGAALAVEIAETLLARRAWTLITTHHDALKAWAGAHAGAVANGSVAVDAVTLAPSYQFRLGVPGVSAGLDMAERLGLPAAVVAGARARLTREEREAGHYLQQLQANLAQAEELRREAEQREREVEARERAIAAHDRSQQQKQMAALRTELERRLANFTAAAEKNWRQAWEGLQGEITAAQKRKLALAAASLKRESAEAFAAEVGAVLGDKPAAAVQAQAGDRVKLRSSSQPARVLRRLGDGGYEVEAGSLRLQVGAAEVAAVLPRAPGREHGVQATVATTQEINLIGLRMEEAVDKLEKFLDQAILAEADQVRIVHGAGFGVLRKAVAETLRAHPQVARFAHPPQNQGGQGVTIAEMK